ncbi:GBS Bsp-like repeat-containing protein [Enterococcus cecorum]|nr:GBS Bsp-like repeat-containing protein [Enterococcus cecorum]
MVNGERKSKGYNQLSVDPDLEQTANIRSIEIQTKFDHVRPDGTIAYTAFNVDNRNLGENLIQDWHIAGLNENQIATNLFNSWKNSPGHYKNMTSEIWTRIGVGISFNSTKQGIYGVQFFSTEPTQLNVNEDGNVEIPLN